MIYENTLDLIGNTPMLRLNNVIKGCQSDIFLKIEKNNPGGSIKDRAALGMIEEAEKQGTLKKGDTIVEPTSGNTGIALAMIGTLKGYKVKIVMPDTMSVERRNIIKAYGAELVLTEGINGMKGAIAKAEEMAREDSTVFIPQQFTNPANPKKHYETTAEEIIKDLPDISAFVCSVGSSGTLMGVAKRLKEYNRDIIVVAVEPERSAVISGEKPGAHKIQGIGSGFIPEIYDGKYVDEIIKVSDDDSYKTARDVAKKDGILVGISTGANIKAAIELSKRIKPGNKIVTVSPDSGEKYISSGLYD
ncbi:cysteine synthase A [Clostridium oryzae]|uniref:Cysteine synthase n=1 Tax=Clostridium oryzae TaxID=1450648 RepID=A0A1V4IJM9_9CLOT|nr:cysteine synthase A [Clostridium oryzae]OPJ60123.1 cysteine synthase [Clostridium oryzae]